MISRELPPHAGGIGAYTQKTSGALAKAGHEVHVFSERQGDLCGEQVVDGVHVHRLPKSRLKPWEARILHRAWRVSREIDRLGPFDVIQACEWEAEATICALRRHAPVITRIATPLYLVAALNSAPASARRRLVVVEWLERWQAQHSTLVFAPSQAMADVVARDWGLDRRKIAVVPTGIGAPKLNGSAPALHSPGRPYVLHFGRLEIRKGTQVWLDALPEVLARYPDLRAVFVGRDVGLDGRSFQEYARERCGLYWDRLEFLPHLPQDQLFPIIAGARLVVLPSLWENLANACLEAMALGRPVVATRGSAYDEMIEEGVSGFLVSPGSAAELERAASAALADPRRLDEVGQAARRRAAEFDLDRVVGMLSDMYRSVARAA